MTFRSVNASTLPDMGNTRTARRIKPKFAAERQLCGAPRPHMTRVWGRETDQGQRLRDKLIPARTGLHTGPSTSGEPKMSFVRRMCTGDKDESSSESEQWFADSSGGPVDSLPAP